MDISLYQTLIFYFIFLIVKTTVDTILDITVPTHEDSQKITEQAKRIFVIRDILSIISFAFIMFILVNYKINMYIAVILFILFFNIIFYVIIEQRYIYHIIDKKYLDIPFIVTIDKYYGRFSKLILYTYILFVIIILYKE